MSQREKDWDDRSCEGTVNVDWTDPEVAAGLNLGSLSPLTRMIRKGGAHGRLRLREGSRDYTRGRAVPLGGH